VLSLLDFSSCRGQPIISPDRHTDIDELQVVLDSEAWGISAQVGESRIRLFGVATNLLALAVTGNTGSVNIAVEQHP
jgi:hypothetical protein